MEESWDQVYDSWKFSISTNTPSEVVSKARDFLVMYDHMQALDLWCGNLRNSVYLASKWVDVTAIDVHTPSKVWDHSTISFINTSVCDFSIVPWYYDIILATRLIQYLDVDEVKSLLWNIANWLKSWWLLALSYTKKWWILLEWNIQVRKFEHPLEMIIKLVLDCGFEILFQENKKGHAKHVTYNTSNENCDLVLRKKYS